MYKAFERIKKSIVDCITKEKEKEIIYEERDPLEFAISRYKTEFLPLIKQKKYQLAAGELINEMGWFEAEIQKKISEYRRCGGSITSINIVSLYVDMKALRDTLLSKDEKEIKKLLQNIDSRHTILENILNLSLHLDE